MPPPPNQGASRSATAQAAAARLTSPGWLLQALGLVLWPPRCGACALALASRPAWGLCAACIACLEPNDGQRCRRCDQPVAEPTADSEACGDCRRRPPAFARLRAPWLYLGGLAELLKTYKFFGRDDLGRPLAALIWQDAQARAQLRAASCLVAVPLGARRARQRGYNQSAVLARQLARWAQVPIHYPLQRCHQGPPQAHLQVAQRHANMQQAFVCRNIDMDCVVLIDDVVTSGETAHQASLALRRGGATEVVVIAVARASKSTQDLIPYEFS